LLVDLTAIRQKHGITVAQAAAACGFTYAVWQRLEAGGSPSLDTALRIARFIEMPVEQIWAIVE
jgi:DNA-binding XRE family transcriptional regulator